MKTVTITEAKNRLSALLHDVQRGETVVVLDRKKPVARIESIDAHSDEKSDVRIRRLQSSGVLLSPRGAGAGDLFSRPPVSIGAASAVQALREERELGR